MSDKKHSRVGLIVALVISAAILGFASWLFMNQRFVADQLSVWSYNAPENVQQIEERVDFTGKGRFYFYATQPEVASSDTFNQDCPRQETNSPILGCYASGRIFIFDIKNEQLDGIKEVTAAHEMLHAVWERMSANEQKRVGSLLRSEYAKLIDGELKDRMDYYARTEPGEFENELHSIIGTEFKNISPALESYYRQFFEDRQKVLALHAKYDALFKSLVTQRDTLFEQLQTLGKTIETRSEAYNAAVTQLSSDIASFNTRAENGDFSSINQFNRERTAMITRTNELTAERASINADIIRYNSLFSQYEEIATQIETLNKSIDSITDLKPAPSL